MAAPSAKPVAVSNDGSNTVELKTKTRLAPLNRADDAAKSATRPSRRHRHQAKAAAKSAQNAAQSESRSKTALVLGGGAPNMALMAGALAAFNKKGITFDVVSTSGAGSVIGLLWLAPKGLPPAEALENVVNLSVSDLIYNQFPVNYKVFNKPGDLASMYRQFLASIPGMSHIVNQFPMNEMQRLWSDWLQLGWACMSPSNLSASSWGLCAPLPFIENVVDFDKIKNVAPYFYLNAYNMTNEVMDDFPKEVLTVDHFRAALAFPFIYGPYKLNGCEYYEGAVRDCLNFKDLCEKHTGIETIVVFDVLGSDSLIRAPRSLYDSWVLSMIIPLVETAEDDLRLFALLHNNGYKRSEGAKADLLKVQFDIPDEFLPDALDWSSSNARRLFKIGYEAGLKFCDDHHAELAKTVTKAK